MRTALLRFSSLPLRVKLLSAVALSCAVALLIGVLGLTRLAALDQRSNDIEGQALVPSMQLAEIRRAFLQTRVDAPVRALTRMSTQPAGELIARSR